MIFLFVISTVAAIAFQLESIATLLEFLPSPLIMLIQVLIYSVWGFSGARLMLGKSSRLMSKISTQNSFSSIDWRDFEKLAGDYYKSKGYSVTLFGGTGGDGGIDLLLKKSFKKYIVQCKHWKGSVGVSVVREMYGVMHAEKANGVIIVCSNRFTKEAIAFAKGKPIRLIDGHTFLKRIKESQ